MSARAEHSPILAHQCHAAVTNGANQHASSITVGDAAVILACLSNSVSEQTNGAVNSARVDLKTMEEQEIYSAIGEEGFTRLVASFYRQVAHDDILRPMYPAEDLEGAEQRLRDFLIYRFGGPPRYILERGHPRLRARHSPFSIDQAARDRWMQLIGNAFAQVTLPSEAEQLLRAFFEGMSTFLINRTQGV
jgi:hemoglobin